MTAPAAPAGELALPPARSLRVDAWRRLRRNRAAVASMVVLAVMALIAVVGPLVWPHPYDRIYPAYVRVPASLEPYPKADAIVPAFEDALRRARLDFDAPELAGSTIAATVRSAREGGVDPRVTRYVERSDLFRNARIEEGDGATRLVADVTRERFVFGTDGNGRDLAARIMVGMRISLAIGVLAAAMSLVLGVAWGATAGYLGGRADAVMMRIVDVLYSLPFIFFVILLVVFFGRSFVLIFIAIGCTEWLDMARIVRGQTLSIKRQEYVEAAHALGVSDAGILARHVIPNTLGPVVVFATLLVPRSILLESLLSFLGLGVQEPLTSLGLLISEGAGAMRGAEWMLIWPALTLTVMLFALNFLGDGLRDALDPKDR